MVTISAAVAVSTVAEASTDPGLGLTVVGLANGVFCPTPTAFRAGLFPSRTIADDRERSQSRLLSAFQSAEVYKLQALYAGGKITSKQHGERRGRNFAASKFISSFSP